MRGLLQRIAIPELSPPILSRILGPFPVPMPTSDAMHLASLEFLRTQGQSVALASYDARLCEAARSLHIPLYEG